MANPKLLSPGDKFEKYVVERELGHGGMGAVYLVRHSILDTRYALKVLFPDVAERDMKYVERFIREGRLAGQIRHRNLIAVYDAGQNEKNGMYYLVMDYVAGGSVRDKIKKSHVVDVAEAASIVRQVACALEAAQNHNMVHRDIKPDNIMFDEQGVVRLADLGIAKATDDGNTGLTLEASVFGTPAYMSPEQARDSSKVDTRADIYSLGVVFYEMLTGRRPFSGNSVIEILTQVIGDAAVPDVRTQVKDIPANVAQLITDMLQKDKEKRIASPTELIRRIDALDLSAYQGGAKTTEEAELTLATMASPLPSPTSAPNATSSATPPSSPPSGTAEPPRTDLTLPTMGAASPVQTPAPPEPTMVMSLADNKGPASSPDKTMVMPDKGKDTPDKSARFKGKGLKFAIILVLAVAVFGIGIALLTRKGGGNKPSPQPTAVQTIEEPRKSVENTTNAPVQTGVDPDAPVHEKPVEKSVEQFVEKPAEPIVEQPAEKPAVDEKTAEPIVEQPSEKPAEPIAQKPVEAPAEPVADKPAEPIAQKPVEAPAEPVAEKPAEPIAQKPVETPAEPVAEKPAEPVVEKPVEKPAEPVADKPAEPIAQKPIEAPAEPVAEKPAEPVADKPAEPIVEKSVKQSTEPIADKPVEPVAEKPVAQSAENPAEQVTPAVIAASSRAETTQPTPPSPRVVAKCNEFSKRLGRVTQASAWLPEATRNEWLEKTRQKIQALESGKGEVAVLEEVEDAVNLLELLSNKNSIHFMQGRPTTLLPIPARVKVVSAFLADCTARLPALHQSEARRVLLPLLEKGVNQFSEKLHTVRNPTAAQRAGLQQLKAYLDIIQMQLEK